MPTVGGFHAKFWRARANAPPAPGVGGAWMYPRVQSAVTLMSSLFGAVSLEAIRPVWDRLVWYWRLLRWLWRLTDEERTMARDWAHAIVALPVDQRDGFRCQLGLDREQRAVRDRVVQALIGPYWADACDKVRACASTPKFHQPEQWVEYGRAIKADRGQAQNVYRHVRIVHELRGAHPAITNPEAHLVTELAYQGVAAMGRAGRRVEPHEVIA